MSISVNLDILNIPVSLHFAVVCSVTWPLNGSEAGGDLVLIQTSLLLFCKQVVLMLTGCIYMKKA